MEPFAASSGNLVGTIDIHDVMIIDMIVFINTLNSDPSEEWESVFHIGNVDANRWPGIWLHTEAGNEGHDLDGFTLSYGNNDNPNDYVEASKAGGAFTDNMEIHYVSIQTQSSLTIIQNDETILDIPFPSHPLPTDVNVYIGDPWYAPADVEIADLVIKAQVKCDCSKLDIDGYLTECSDVFDETVVNLREEVTANAAEIASIKEELALIADINYDGSSSATLFDLDINHQNYLLLCSLFVNVILAMLIYCTCIKSRKNKQYSKGRAYVDSDN